MTHVTKPETMKDLHKIVCDPNSVLDPGSDVKKVVEELSEAPGVYELREVAQLSRQNQLVLSRRRHPLALAYKGSLELGRVHPARLPCT